MIKSMFRLLVVLVFLAAAAGIIVTAMLWYKWGNFSSYRSDVGRSEPGEARSALSTGSPSASGAAIPQNVPPTRSSALIEDTGKGQSNFYAGTPSVSESLVASQGALVPGEDEALAAAVFPVRSLAKADLQVRIFAGRAIANKAELALKSVGYNRVLLSSLEYRGLPGVKCGAGSRVAIGGLPVALADAGLGRAEEYECDEVFLPSDPEVYVSIPVPRVGDRGAIPTQATDRRKARP